MSAPELRLPVEAQGHLRLDAPTGRTLEFVADGDTLTLEVPSWGELKGFAPASFSARISSLRDFAYFLSVTALTLRLETRGRPFLEIGADVRPNWFARIARVGPVRLKSPIFGLFLRR